MVHTCLDTNSSWKIYVIKYTPPVISLSAGTATAFLLLPISGTKSCLLCEMGSLPPSTLVPLLPLAQALPAGFARFLSGTPLPSGSQCTAKPASPHAPQPAAASENLLEGLCRLCVGMCLSRQQLMQMGKSLVYAKDDMLETLFPEPFLP